MNQGKIMCGCIHNSFISLNVPENIKSFEQYQELEGIMFVPCESETNPSVDIDWKELP